MSFKKMEAVIKGNVQGVGFRFFTERIAILLDITGWVANLPDGDVKVMAVGSPDKIEEFLTILQRGPTSSNVEDVKYSITDCDTNDYDNFEILS